MVIAHGMPWQQFETSISFGFSDPPHIMHARTHIGRQDTPNRHKMVHHLYALPGQYVPRATAVHEMLEP